MDNGELHINVGNFIAGILSVFHLPSQVINCTRRSSNGGNGNNVQVLPESRQRCDLFAMEFLQVRPETNTSTPHQV